MPSTNPFDEVLEQTGNLNISGTNHNMHPPSIRIETTQSDGRIAEEEAPRLPSRPVSPRLPARPQSPRLPDRRQRDETTNTLAPNNAQAEQLDIPSPRYTPVASPNETVLPADGADIPALDLGPGQHDEEIDTGEAPPPYSEAAPELHGQIYTAPFSNTGGHIGYVRPSERPPQPSRPAPQQQFQPIANNFQVSRPAGPPPSMAYSRPPHPPPPQRQRPSSTYPGRSNATYGAAAYAANQPPLPPRH